MKDSLKDDHMKDDSEMNVSLHLSSFRRNRQSKFPSRDQPHTVLKQELLQIRVHL